MNIKKFRCPICNEELFGLDEDEKKVYNTDDMGIPLFAPTWIVENIWQEDRYFPVECRAGHESVLFTKSNRIISVEDFHKEMDKKEADRELADLECLIGQKAAELCGLKAKYAAFPIR